MTKETFDLRLSIARNKLGKSYSNLVRFLHPTIDMDQLYNTINGKVRHEHILTILEKTVAKMQQNKGDQINT